ncbi:hypothetical protein [Mesorhizobium sp. A623]
MNNFKRLVYDLEDYARQQGGRFWLLDVNKYTESPPQGQLWVVVDFEQGAVPATIYVDITGKKHGVPYRVSQAADLTEKFKSTVLPNALVLWGPPYDPPTGAAND